MVPDRIEREIVIEAPVDVVWAVVTEPEQISGWLSDSKSGSKDDTAESRHRARNRKDESNDPSGWYARETGGQKIAAGRIDIFPEHGEPEQNAGEYCHAQKDESHQSEITYSSGADEVETAGESAYREPCEMR